MSTVAPRGAVRSPLDLGGLPAAARTALGADAVAIVELRPDVAVLVATDGFHRDEASTIAAAVGELGSCADVPGTKPVAAAGFHSALCWQVATADGARMALLALRREAGPFEHTGLGMTFVTHAQCAAAVRRHVASALEPPSRGASDARLFEAESWPGLMRAVAKEAAALTGAARVGVLVWDEHAGILQLLPGSFDADLATAASARAAPVDWWSSAARVFTTGQPFIANDTSADCGLLRDYTDAFGISRVASLGLETDGRRVGVLQLADKPTEFTIADLVAAVGPAVAVTRSRLRLQRRNRHEEILGRVAVDIASGKSLQEFLASALDDLCEACDVDFVAVVAPVGEPIVWRHGAPRPDLESVLLEEANRSTGLRAYVVGAREPGDPGWAALHVPINLDGEDIATLSSLRGRGEAFGRDERQAMSRLASLTALAWATESYQRQQAQLARLAERERIADELHDHTAQLLLGARLSLDGTLEVAELTSAAAVSIGRAYQLITRSEVAIRQAIRQLAPSPNDELGSRLAATVGGIEEEYGHPVQLEITPAAARAAAALGPSRTSLLTKVTREALVNAAKHAGPCQLAVRLAVTRRGRLLLSVSDDGIGLGTRRPGAGHGLNSLRRAVRQHGGDLRLRSASTGGTRVSVSLHV